MSKKSNVPNLKNASHKKKMLAVIWAFRRIVMVVHQRSLTVTNVMIMKKLEILWELPKCDTGTVQFSRSVVSDSLQPHELQHARPPCPSPTSGVHPNPRPSKWWCHPAIASSAVPFSSSLQSFPAPASFPWVSCCFSMRQGGSRCCWR